MTVPVTAMFLGLCGLMMMKSPGRDKVYLRKTKKSKSNVAEGRKSGKTHTKMSMMCQEILCFMVV